MGRGALRFLSRTSVHQLSAPKKVVLVVTCPRKKGRKNRVENSQE